MYNMVYQPTNENILQTNEDLFDTVNFHQLEVNYHNLLPVYSSSASAVLTPHSVSTTTSSTLSTYCNTKSPDVNTPNDIYCINFLKYVKLKLHDKDDILIFYRDIYYQGKHYNVHVTKLEDIINVRCTTVPSTISNTTTITN